MEATSNNAPSGLQSILSGAMNAAAACHATDSAAAEETLALRRKHIGPNTALFFEDPCIVRGQGTYLYDDQGREYLDCINNVAHVGHCHPQVTAALCQQLGTLNTNSRYLHPTLPRYAQALTATLPDPLSVAYMVNSGSEANDLALRIAEAARPGQTHTAVVAGAYHGHTSALIPLSSYKFWGPGGSGRAPHVHIIPCPDTYRGTNLDGRKAARAVLDAARQAGGRVGIFFCESILSCGGQVFLPPGYLQGLYEEMRGEGALCVADEVQCGFGRVGDAFWAFQTQGVVPDIVTMGKPMGNGFPMAALVTTPELAGAFASGGMEYFNTYGGCTAAAAVGTAVLEAIQRERLQDNAAVVGTYLLDKLQAMQAEHPLLGDIRGMGLMIGMEVVRSPQCKRPAPAIAAWIKARMFARRVLLSVDGPFVNVLKLKPPMVFSLAEADAVLTALRAVLAEELTPERRAELEAEEEGGFSVVLQQQQLYATNAAELHRSSL